MEVYILAYSFIFLLCMVGNILVCLIVLENRCMRTVTNLFILNLAISDLLVGIFCIPTTLVDNLITGNTRLNMHSIKPSCCFQRPSSM
uniref:G-protein coupled receptors family 1 profile domain-containing protein n=1 Tax=Nothobranchius furzeri TaxID=105023 RepID=A0A8C6Q3N4_NOTFU